MVDSSIDNKFVSGAVKLSGGRHITHEDKQKVMVHEDFALLNGLALGDTIKVKTSKMSSVPLNARANKTEIELEVVGLFSGSNMDSALTTEELVENVLISDLDTVFKMKGYNEEDALFQDAKYFVKDANRMPEILEIVKRLPMDWSRFVITESSNDYPALTGSLNSMDKLIDKMLIGIVVVSATVLSLVLAFWVNGRIHETGVLLSLSVSKLNIISQ